MSLITKKFKSVKINKLKKEKIRKVAIKIRDKKNELSYFTFHNYKAKLFYQRDSFYNKSKFSFFKFKNETQPKKDESYGSRFFGELQKEVYTNYESQVSNLRLTFHSTSNLHTVVKFLVFHYNPYKTDIVKFSKILKTYVNKISKKKCPTNDELGKMKFYQLILTYINKYSNRPNNELLKTVKYLQQLMILRIHKCNYKSLNFSSYNTLSNRKPMIEYAKNLSKNSEANGIINFNLQKIETCIEIPCKISDSYHGNLNEYNYEVTRTNQSLLYYNFIFCDDGEIAIHVLKEDEDYGKYNIVNTTSEEDTIGADANTKNNLFALSNGTFVNYDEKLIKQARRYHKYLAKIQHNKEVNKNPKKYGNKVKKRINKINRRAEGHEQRKVHNLIRIAKKLHKRHIVMENLDIRNKTRAKHKEGDNYNDVAKILHLNDYKNEVKKQANKKDIMVSFVDAHYTSQTCSECGHISKQNREGQETFSCKHCGFTINADTNASINIKNRITIEGLRKALEKYDSKAKMYKEIPYKRKSIYQNIYRKIYG